MSPVDLEDRCTLSPDGHWKGCCARHDKAYEAQRGPRWKRDSELWSCIAKLGLESIGESVILMFTSIIRFCVGMRTFVYSFFVFIFVRCFGWIYWNKSKRICGPIRSRQERKAREESSRAPGP